MCRRQPMPLGDELGVYIEAEDDVVESIRSIEIVIDVFPNSPPEPH